MFGSTLLDSRSGAASSDRVPHRTERRRADASGASLLHDKTTTLGGNHRLAADPSVTGDSTLARSEQRDPTAHDGVRITPASANLQRTGLMRRTACACTQDAARAPARPLVDRHLRRPAQLTSLFAPSERPTAATQALPSVAKHSRDPGRDGDSYWAEGQVRPAGAASRRQLLLSYRWCLQTT
jgi:hypothetical protein